MFALYQQVTAQEGMNTTNNERPTTTHATIDYYNSAKANYNAIRANQSSLTFKDLGLKRFDTCNQVCSTLLIDLKTKEMRFLPEDFDAGIIDLLFSPKGELLLQYASYDGPDYFQYYSNRSVIRVYEITKHKGVNALKEKNIIFNNDWSIEDIIWVNDRTIVLKTYSAGVNEALDNNKYEYYIMNVLQE